MANGDLSGHGPRADLLGQRLVAHEASCRHCQSPFLGGEPRQCPTGRGLQNEWIRAASEYDYKQRHQRRAAR